MFPSLDSRDRIPRVPTWLNWVVVFSSVLHSSAKEFFSWNTLRLYFFKSKWARRALKICKFSFHSFSFDHKKWILLQREASDESLVIQGGAFSQDLKMILHLIIFFKKIFEMRRRRKVFWRLEIPMNRLRLEQQLFVSFNFSRRERGSYSLKSSTTCLSPFPLFFFV